MRVFAFRKCSCGAFSAKSGEHSGASLPNAQHLANPAEDAKISYAYWLPSFHFQYKKVKDNKPAALDESYYLITLHYSPSEVSASAHALSSSTVTSGEKRLPSFRIESGQLGRSSSFVLPISLEPDVANGITVLSVRS